MLNLLQASLRWIRHILIWEDTIRAYSAHYCHEMLGWIEPLNCDARPLGDLASHQRFCEWHRLLEILGPSVLDHLVSVSWRLWLQVGSVAKIVIDNLSSLLLQPPHLHAYWVLLASEIFAHKGFTKGDRLFSSIRQLAPSHKRLQLLALIKLWSSLRLLLTIEMVIIQQTLVQFKFRGQRAIRTFDRKLIINVVGPQYMLEFIVVVNLANS